jgi:hypothetical protein
LTQAEAGADTGMFERQIKTAVRVAYTVADQFEQAAESDKPPAVTTLAER